MDKFDLTSELQKRAAESEDIEVVIDENGIVKLRLAGRIGTDGMEHLISDLSK